MPIQEWAFTYSLEENKHCGNIPSSPVKAAEQQWGPGDHLQYRSWETAGFRTCPCSHSSREQWPLWKGGRILHKGWNMPGWPGLQNTRKAASPPLSEQLTSGQRQPGSPSRWSDRCRKRSSSRAGSWRSRCCRWKRCDCRSGRWGACTGEREQAVRAALYPHGVSESSWKNDGSEQSPWGAIDVCHWYNTHSCL